MEGITFKSHLRISSTESNGDVSHSDKLMRIAQKNLNN